MSNNIYKKLLEALNRLPTKELLAGEICDDQGRFCAVGAMIQVGGGFPPSVPDDAVHNCIASAAEYLQVDQNPLCDIQVENDTFGGDNGQRWHHMRAWALNLVSPD